MIQIISLRAGRGYHRIVERIVRCPVDGRSQVVETKVNPGGTESVHWCSKCFSVPHCDAACLPERLPESKRAISTLMSTEVLTVHPETPLGELAIILRENEISGVPVVNAQGKLVGVVSVTDLALAVTSEDLRTALTAVGGDFYQQPWSDPAWCGQLEQGGFLVRDIMSTKLITAEQTEIVCDVLERMLEAGVRRVVVVNREFEVAGLVSCSDLMGYLLALCRYSL